MPEIRIEQPLVPRGLYWWAALTVVATVGLLGLGSIVTTFRVGMTDPVWPTYPWHLLLISYDEPQPGFLIEHTHRLAGYIVGCCVIVLAVWLALASRRPLLARLGWAALGCVILQGLLGGFRVRLNALVGTDLAAVHGVFAQVVFSLLVSLAVMSSRSFARPSNLGPSEAVSLRNMSMILTAIVFVQIVWGSLTRHTYHPLAQRLHFLTAFAVVAAVAWFVKTVWDSPAAWERLHVPALLLVGLVVLQLMLGVEAWLARFASGELPELQQPTATQAVIRTAHVLLGSWLLAISVSCILLARGARASHLAAVTERVVERPRTDAIQSDLRPATSVHQLEGTA